MEKGIIDTTMKNINTLLNQKNVLLLFLLLLHFPKKCICERHNKNDLFRFHLTSMKLMWNCLILWF